MTAPPGAAAGGLTELAVRARVDAGQVNSVPRHPVAAWPRSCGRRWLELDEALLTGEVESVRKQPGDTVLSGSAVVAGARLIRADRVGGDAYAARLQAQARRFSLIRSELQQGTNQILRLVTWGDGPGRAAADRKGGRAGRRENHPTACRGRLAAGTMGA